MPHLKRVSHSLEDIPYFGGTGKSDHRHSFHFLSLQMIIVVIMVDIMGLQFRIMPGDDCIYSHGSQHEYHVVCPFIVHCVSELRNVTTPGVVQSRFREVIEENNVRSWRWCSSLGFVMRLHE
jgi:hypothetical protein